MIISAISSLRSADASFHVPLSPPLITLLVAFRQLFAFAARCRFRRLIPYMPLLLFADFDAMLIHGANIAATPSSLRHCH